MYNIIDEEKDIGKIFMTLPQVSIINNLQSYPVLEMLITGCSQSANKHFNKDEILNQINPTLNISLEKRGLTR